MYRVCLISGTEAGGVIERDLESMGTSVAAIKTTEAETDFATADVDAFVLEAPYPAEETRRLVELAAKQNKTALILVLRAEQMAALDPSWPVDDFLVLPIAAEELALRLRRSIWRRRGI